MENQKETDRSTAFYKLTNSRASNKQNLSHDCSQRYIKIENLVIFT